MTEHVHDNDLAIDLLCRCGEPDAQMGWSEFLTGFAEAEVLPERREPLVLRVRFAGQGIDAELRRVLSVLVARGAARQTGESFEMPGICARSCGNPH